MGKKSALHVPGSSIKLNNICRTKNILTIEHHILSRLTNTNFGDIENLLQNPAIVGKATSINAKQHLYR